MIPIITYENYYKENGIIKIYDIPNSPQVKIFDIYRLGENPTMYEVYKMTLQLKRFYEFYEFGLTFRI